MASRLSLFQASDDGACGVDRLHQIVLWNQAAETMLGYPAREVIGRPCFEVFRGADGDDRPICGRLCPIFGIAQRTGAAPTGFTLRVPRRTGEHLWLSVSTLAIPSRWNTEVILVHLFRNVSHLKTCEAAVRDMLEVMRHDAVAPGDDAGRRPPPEATPCLTPREHEVLRLLAEGRSTREIAGALFVSPSTVRNHVHNVLEKLDAHSRLEAVTTALRFNLV